MVAGSRYIFTWAFGLTAGLNMQWTGAGQFFSMCDQKGLVLKKVSSHTMHPNMMDPSFGV